MTDRASAIQWAQNILTLNPVILDTETTGLESYDQICQIAIINVAGETLLDTLVKPTRPIQAEATRIHGIADRHVGDAPSWLGVSVAIVEAISDKDVIIFNADFDMRLMRQSDKAHGIEYTWTKPGHIHCAMLQYAAFWGDWNDYRHNYAWQSLDKALQQQRLTVSASAHSALGDCLRTLAIVKAMAASGEGGS